MKDIIDVHIWALSMLAEINEDMRINVTYLDNFTLKWLRKWQKQICSYVQQLDRKHTVIVLMDHAPAWTATII